jgi:hypothetical protein
VYYRIREGSRERKRRRGERLDCPATKLFGATS